MRCKKHLTDLSGSVGVCASCLRERLFALVAAQAQVEALEDRRKSDLIPQPPLVFPRSVSPYICPRKHDLSAGNHRRRHHTLPDQLFYSTPQVGPAGAINTQNSYKKPKGKLSLLTRLFRSESKKIDSDPGVSVSNNRNSCPAPASSASPSWFSNMLAGDNKKQSIAGIDRRTGRSRDRGMSPAGAPHYGEEEEYEYRSSGYSSESSQGCKQTPQRAAAPARRGGGRPNHGRNVSGLAFCLSPLVRASPNQHRNQKGMQPEMAFTGEVRVPVKPHLSTAAAFCKNRSRKLVDFGRYNHNH